LSRAEYLRQQAWDYFALHAQQRLTTVRFYLIVAAALTAASIASLGGNFEFPGLGQVAGSLLSILSFAFWRLDLRNRELIKAAEAALRSFEVSGRADECTREPPVAWLFTREYRQSEKRKQEGSWKSWVPLRSYSHVFNLLFASFFAVGILFTVLASR